MSKGRVFQSVGAATEKDLAPYVFKLKCGIERRSFQELVLKLSYIIASDYLTLNFV